jgi:hypothetical protein
VGFEDGLDLGFNLGFRGLRHKTSDMKNSCPSMLYQALRS